MVVAFRLLQWQRIISNTEHATMTLSWITSNACRSREHCDFCLGNEAWHKSQCNLRDGEGNPAWMMPKFGTCPFAETVAKGKARRADTLVRRVAAGTVTLEAALTAAEGLRLELDTPTKA